MRTTDREERDVQDVVTNMRELRRLDPEVWELIADATRHLAHAVARKDQAAVRAVHDRLDRDLEALHARRESAA